jgi:hypothetical protein
MARGLSIRITLCVLWLSLVGAGFAVILNYQNAGGRIGITPLHWPAGAAITLDHDHDTLLMFAHPQCPCTRASIEELNRLLAQSHGAVAAHVLFFKPAGFPTDWTRAGLWQSASAIPGVMVHDDLNGSQARQFGAETSGYVLLYDTQGQLLFQGGITGGRGHAGDNAGENALLSLLAGKSVNSKQTEVYGCSLLAQCPVSQEGAAK